MPIAVSTTSLPRATHATSGATTTDASATGALTTGGSQDFMSAFLAALEAQQATAGTGATVPAATGSVTSATSVAQAGGLDILALLAKLGIKTTGTASTDAAGDGKTTKDATTTDATGGTVVPLALQPQLAALGLTDDTSLVSTAAQKAISAVSTATPGVGLAVNTLLRGLDADPATGSAQVTAGQTTAASHLAQAATDASHLASPATAQTVAQIETSGTATASAAAATSASAVNEALAAQGITAITGKITADAQIASETVHTVANQTAADTSDPSKAASHVALAALQQASGSATTPLSRMADIRSRLQAAQIGAGKASASGTTSAAGTATAAATASDLLGGASVASAAGTIVDPAAKQGFAQLVDKAATAATAKSADQIALGNTPSDKSSTGADSGTTQDQLDAQFNAGLSNLTQGQSSQTTSQSTAATAQAIPLAAVAATIASHAKIGSSEFNIRLDPAGLGQIDVKMKVSSDGEVRAHLIVDQPATLDLMMRDRQQLQQQLDQAGFKTDSSSLQFSLRDQGQGSSQQQAWQQQAASSRASSTSTASDPTTSPIPSAVYARPSYIRTDAIDISI